MKKIENYLCETETIDYSNEVVAEKIRSLKSESDGIMDYIEKAYLFVRDEITHSWDVKADVVSRKASEVLKNGTGICWTKSCLLAALLRGNGIPSGISCQKLTRSDADESDGYIIHALNTIFIPDLNKWIRVDARGNKSTVHAEFNVEKEILAFPVRENLNEFDYKNNDFDLDPRLVEILKRTENITEIRTDFDFDPVTESDGIFF